MFQGSPGGAQIGRLASFIHVSVDGCYAGPNGERDWFKVAGKNPEYDAWTHQQATGGSTPLGDTYWIGAGFFASQARMFLRDWSKILT